MKLLNKIHVYNITYITILISFISGYFEYIFLLLLIIIIHELGHLLVSSLFNFKIDKIYIYPVGGITKYNEHLNISIYKELLVLIGGPLTQILFFIFCKLLYINGYININTFEIIELLNKYLLMFNLLPILPLDGGRLLNVLLDYFFSYKLSFIISIIISFISILIVLVYKIDLLLIILFIFIISSLIQEIKMFKLKYKKFLLERHLYNFYFKKEKIIKNINDFKREYKHKIKYNNLIYNEREFLAKIFKFLS